MKYIFSLLLALLVSSAPLLAQVMDIETGETNSFAPTAEENALLGRISGNDLATPSDLYGTIHLIGKDDFFLTDSTKIFLDQAELVTFEINMEDMMDLGAQMGLLMKSFMEDGKTLRDLLNDEDYALVKAHFDKIGLPLFMLERIKPMFLTVMASGDMSPDAMQTGEMVSYELEFMELAQAGKKKMGGLETMEFQMSVFDSIPYEAQAISISVAAGNPLGISTPDDLAGKVIGVEIGGFEEAKIKLLSEELVGKGMDAIDVRTFDNFATAYQALRAGQTDGTVSIDSTAADYAKRGEFDRAISGMFATPVALAMANDELAEAVLGVLRDMKGDGTYDALLDEYGILTNDTFEIRGPSK